MELQGIQDDEDSLEDVNQVHCIGKRRKRKTKIDSRQRYNLWGQFCFGDQDTIESVITLRIDSRTMKRGTSWLNWLSSATR